MLFAIRDGSAPRIDRAGLPELRLEPLNDASSAAVLDANAPGLAPGLRRRILAEALGNPLALAELPRAVASGFDPACGCTAAAHRTAGTRICRDACPACLRPPAPFSWSLPSTTAATRSGSSPRHRCSKNRRAVGVAELADAQAARAVTVDGDGLRFRHPLVRSAIHQRSLAPERRAAHKALASVYRSDPDRGVWHLAASLTSPDDRDRGGARGHG